MANITSNSSTLSRMRIANSEYWHVRRYQLHSVLNHMRQNQAGWTKEALSFFDEVPFNNDDVSAISPPLNIKLYNVKNTRASGYDTTTP